MGGPYPEIIHPEPWRKVLRLPASLLGLLATAAILLACGGGDNAGVVVSTVEPTNQTAAQGNGTPELHGFIYPIVGGCLPQGDQLMPNAPRAYRDGTHEGVDFYNVDNCTPIGLGTPVVAAKAGKIVRIDHEYQNLTREGLVALRANPTAPESLDAYRGRQVWIDHGGGVVTRYCHLNGVVDSLKVGDSVTAGQTIAYVGESGTPQSVESPGSESEFHLHFEVRVGDSYLGAGESPAQVRALYLALFQP